MKITKQILKKLIKEELGAMLEQDPVAGRADMCDLNDIFEPLKDLAQEVTEMTGVEDPCHIFAGVGSERPLVHCSEIVGNAKRARASLIVLDRVLSQYDGTETRMPTLRPAVDGDDD